MNTYLIISSIANCLAALLLVGNILSSRRRNPVAYRFVWFLVSVAGWAGAYVFWRYSSSEESALLFCKILTSFSIFISLTLYDFCLKLSGKLGRLSVGFGYIVGLVIVGLTVGGSIVAGVSSKHGHTFWPDAGPLMPLYLMFFAGYLLASGWILVVNCRYHLGARSKDSLFVLFVCCIGFIGGATNFPLWFDIPVQPYGNGLVAVYVLLMGYGLYENRYLKVGVDLYRFIISASLSVSAAVFYTLIFGFYQSYIGSEVTQSGLWLQGVWAFFVSALIFWGVPRLKLLVEIAFARVFQNGLNDAIVSLKTLPSRIADLLDEQEVLSEVQSTIFSSLEVDRVAILRLDSLSGYYRCVCATDAFSLGVEAFELEPNSALIEGIAQQPKCLVLDQIFEELSPIYYASLVDLRNRFDLSVIVPIFVGHEIFGLILIGRPKHMKLWRGEESSMLFNIGAQVGLNFRTRDIERRANEVDKLVALGTMAAGLSHEIRNPLVSVQTMASLIQSGKSIDAVSKDFKEVLLRDVKRIGSIVEGVASYSQNQQVRKVPVSIVDAVHASVAIYQKLAEDAGVALTLEYSDEQSTVVLGSYDQLVQVFNNLIENALHALRSVEHPKLLIQVNPRSSLGHRRKNLVEVLVVDNGPGVPAAIVSRVFDPFITSKDTGDREDQHGMGLGLAITKRIIDRLGGVISVCNLPQGGAKFIVSLKVFNSEERHGEVE